MKSESTIRRQVKRLREVIENGDIIETRIAYAMEAALQYVLHRMEPMVSLQAEARKNAQILREELRLKKAMS